MKPKMTAGRALLYLILIIYALITLYPFLWMVAASFKPLREIVGGNMSLISENMTLDNYATIFGHSSLFPRWFLNSLFMATVGTVINVYINSMAGYSLSRLSFPGRDKIYHALLLLMMIPGQVLLIPNYLLLKDFGMLDSFTALILPSAANIGNIFLMRQFFSTLPRELDEAARIDGCSYFRTYWNVLLPLVKPGLTTLAILGMLNTWKDLMWPLINNSQADKMTLAAGLAMLIGEHTTYYEQVMAGGVIAVLPLIVLFVIFQRQFVEGIAHSGIKG